MMRGWWRSMDWGLIIKIGEVATAIAAVVGFLASVILNLRKIIHVYDKMENLIKNNEIVNKYSSDYMYLEAIKFINIVVFLYFCIIYRQKLVLLKDIVLSCII